MIKRLINIALAIITIVFLIGCDSGELIPLKVGNTWIYKSEKLDNDGSPVTSFYSYMTILADTTVDGVKYSIRNGNNRADFCTNNKDGFSIYQKGQTPLLDLKYPVTLNETFIRRNRDTTFVTALDDKVEVPAGKFTCIKYETLSNDSKLVYHVCPTVGIIKIENYTLEGDVYKPQAQLSLTNVFLQ
jgi:hypothetical protein